MEVTAWPAAAWVGRTKAPKLTCSFVLHCSGEEIVGYFLATVAVDSGEAGLGIVVSVSRKLLDVTTWPEVT